MITLSDLLMRLRDTLQDETGSRYPDALLEEAVRCILDEISLSSPQIADTMLTISNTGRNQSVPGVQNPLFLISVTDAEGLQMEPDAQFSYTLQAGQPVLHFLGCRIPQAGEVYTVTCALPHTLSGLNGSETSTLSERYVSLLVTGAAGRACLLRAGALVESYGKKSSETNQLLEQSRLLMDQFQKQLEGMKILQEFGFPRGFALDHWDSQNRKVF